MSNHVHIHVVITGGDLLEYGGQKKNACQTDRRLKVLGTDFRVTRVCLNLLFHLTLLLIHQYEFDGNP